MSHGIASGPPPQRPRSGPRGDDDGPVCPECGAKRITSAQAPCWMCGAILPPLDSPVPGGPIRGRGDNPFFVGVGVLVLAALVLIVAVNLAIEGPGLLIILALAMTPPLIRSVVVSRRAQTAGQPLSGAEKVGAFFGAIGATVLVGAAAFVAFFATCFAVCLGMLAIDERGAGDIILPVSVFAGLVPGILILVWLLRLIWKKRS
jgi:hypothetical protein